MLLLRLYLEYFKVGLFSVGGGLATIPFLTEMGGRTGWFTPGQLADMIAVSEATPGPIGVNMATYVGFTTAGFPGAVVATLGLITPSVLVIFLVAAFLQKFRQSQTVDGVFRGLRPASVALITSAGVSVAMASLVLPNGGGVHWGALILAVAVFAGMKYTPLKKLHPIVFIGASAVIGVLFQL